MVRPVFASLYHFGEAAALPGKNGRAGLLAGVAIDARSERGCKPRQGLTGTFCSVHVRRNRNIAGLRRRKGKPDRNQSDKQAPKDFPREAFGLCSISIF